MEIKKQIKIIKSKLKKIKEAGINKVELCCFNDCECCKEYKNKQIPIQDLELLPMEKSPYDVCFGCFNAVVEFENTDRSKVMEFDYAVKKHWFHWVMPVIWSVIFCWTIIIPVFLLLYTFLRMKLDKIYIKDGCLHSRSGLILIDKKAIPLKQISFITVKADIISEWLKMGCIYVQSSANANDIRYMYIKEPEKMVEYVNNYKMIS